MAKPMAGVSAPTGAGEMLSCSPPSGSWALQKTQRKVGETGCHSKRQRMKKGQAPGGWVWRVVADFHISDGVGMETDAHQKKEARWGQRAPPVGA